MPLRSAQLIEEIQHALARRGFSPGPVDGIWGRQTEAAVRAFQAANALLVDGIAGPITQRALFGAQLEADPLNDAGIPWFQEARRQLGTREVPGPASNPEILQWADQAGIPYKNDDIAWCGLFVAHCITSTLAAEPLPANPLGARQWLKFGAPCSVRPGAVLVFWRVKPTSWKGHVGFYAGEDDTAYNVLGGNQGNQVSVARISKSRLLEARWPATAPLTDAGPLRMAASGVMSTNEA